MTLGLLSAAVLSACGGGSGSNAELPAGTDTLETAQGLKTYPKWTKVANEWANFTVGVTQTVRFGAGTKWVQKTVSGTEPCTAAYFGS
ncbi:MAG TPA: glycoside hydrolase family 5 protein, partial [Albitalea sp.]|nr:glycoside hydrolase family 5 protein [Albitalea sp.]